MKETFIEEPTYVVFTDCTVHKMIFFIADQGHDNKLGRFELKPQEDSTFEKFMKHTKNMPMIWENIMSQMPGEDVASCLKVCKELRSIISQCMATNITFRRQMHSAATSSGIRRGRFHYKDDFLWKYRKEDVYSLVCALDGLYYHHWRRYANSSSPFHLPSDGKLSKASKSTKSLKVWCRSSMVVHSTVRKRKIFFQDHNCQPNEEQSMNPVKLRSDYAEVIDNSETDSALNTKELLVRFSKPSCILYRVFVNEDQDKSEEANVSINLETSGKDDTKEDITYKFKKVKDFHISHSPSNEQVYLYTI